MIDILIFGGVAFLLLCFVVIALLNITYRDMKETEFDESRKKYELHEEESKDETK